LTARVAFKELDPLLWLRQAHGQVATQQRVLSPQGSAVPDQLDQMALDQVRTRATWWIST
jgi:CHASE3 domain sensor protein